ncbi:LuxR C-terminal-related transcriptional regulator [Pseudarthrobacter sp. P1]|uniref:helix-turn-helix transcriptional regulator n=1 Tax=Pseudarthrobacter sp. P1 TaxID=3418418 RepID=UPI003CF3E9B0
MDPSDSESGSARAMPGLAAPREPWIDHNAVVATIEGMLEGAECRAVFVLADYGLGASSLLARLGERAPTGTTVLAVHATPALAAVPYGALAPYLADVRGGNLTRVLVLRALWERLGPAAAAHRPALVLVDDAQVLDDASAEIITELVRAEWAKVVATSKPRPGLPDPLVRLWDEGWAERFDLQPLGPAQVHELCTLVLGGTVMASTSRSLWAASGGNPLMVKTLLAEFRRSGALLQRNGVWLLTSAGYGGTPLEAADVVAMQLRRLSAPAREVLNLIALAEPVEQAQVVSLLGEEPLAELLDERLVQRGGRTGTALGLVNPLYGAVLRRTVPASRSMDLHRRFLATMVVHPDEPAALLRFVAWSLECGTDVEDALLVRAAELACKIFRNETALRIAAAVRDPALNGRRAAIMARAHFNMGHYAQAAELLEPAAGHVPDLDSMMFHSLLRAAVRTALGHPVADISADAAALRAWGQHESQRARDAGDEAAAAQALAATATRSSVLDLLAASMTGDYATMGPLAEKLLAAAPAEPGQGQLLTRALVLALDAERQCAMGRPLAGVARAMEAFAIVQPEGQSVFFLPEFILVRHLACCLSAGEWAAAQTLMDEYFLSSGAAMVSFSGSIHVGIGYMAVRQGNLARAQPILMAGLEALRESDPEQMMSLCAALAFYAAAALGQRETAESLMAEYLDWTKAGMYLVTSNARDYFNAGLELLRGDGSGIAALLASADAAAVQHAAFLELHALELAVGLGERSRLERFTELAGRTEGGWAAALAKYGWALQAGDVPHYLRAGDALREAGIYGAAVPCYEGALALMGRNHDREMVPRVRELLAQCREATGADWDGAEDAAPRPASALLTRREREVVDLVLAGLGDKEIAGALHLSVRTVEGHLYRCYTKLGITARGQLAAAVESRGQQV